MKVLQLTKKFPYPAKDGESIAILSIAEGYYSSNCKIDLLAMNTIKHYVEENIRVEIPNFYNSVKSIDINSNVKFIPAILNLLTQRSYNIERFISKEYRSALINLLNENDYNFIQLETLYLVPYIETIRAYSNAKIVFRSHNMEYEIWKNLAASEPSLIKKWYYNICNKRLKKYEQAHLDKYDLLLPITEQDRVKYEKIGYKGEVSVTPVGIKTDIENNNSTSDQQTIKIGYIGSLDWRPNIEGLLWFFKTIWPNITEKYPELRFHLAGRGGSQSFIDSLPSNVVYHGEVDSAVEFLSQLQGIVAPLISGSGIRVKILESMAIGKSVMSTPKGFEGIPITHEKHAILFDEPDQLNSALDKWYNDSGYRREMGSNARSLILDRFDIKGIAEDVLKHI